MVSKRKAVWDLENLLASVPSLFCTLESPKELLKLLTFRAGIVAQRVKLLLATLKSHKS